MLGFRVLGLGFWVLGFRVLGGLFLLKLYPLRTIIEVICLQYSLGFYLNKNNKIVSKQTIGRIALKRVLGLW